MAYDFNAASRAMPIVRDRTIPRRDFAGLVATDRAVREEILHCAYVIWEKQGRPENRRLEHWLLAQAEVLRRS